MLTGDLSAGGTDWPIYSYSRTLGDIRKSVDEHGYAVATMHPMKFSVRSGLQFEDSVDSQQIEELELLLDKIEAEGYEVVTLGEMSRRTPARAS